MFPGKFHFDVDGPTVRNTVTHNIALTMLAHTDDGAVLSVELTDRVVPSNAAVLTEGYDDFVLENGFRVNKDRLPCDGKAIWCRSGLFIGYADIVQDFS